MLAVLTGADFQADGLKPIPPDASIIAPIEAQRALPDVVLVHRHGAMKPTPYYPLAVDKVRLRRRGGRDCGRRHAGDREGRSRACRHRLRGASRRLSTPRQRPSRTRPRLWDHLPLECVSRRRGRRCRRDRRAPSPAPPMSRAWRPGCSVSPACRWRRAPRSAITTRRAGAIFCTPAAAVSCVRRPRSPPSLVCRRRSRSTWSLATSAAISAPRIRFSRNFPLVLWASRRVGRPVKWVCERSEAFLSDYQGRDLVAKIELALDKRGKFLAMRGSHLSNIGAYRGLDRPAAQGRDASSPASIAFRSRTIRRSRCSPTRRRRRPIAAPGGRKRRSSWSGCATSPRSRPASTASRSDAAI